MTRLKVITDRVAIFLVLGLPLAAILIDSGSGPGGSLISGLLMCAVVLVVARVGHAVYAAAGSPKLSTGRLTILGSVLGILIVLPLVRAFGNSVGLQLSPWLLLCGAIAIVLIVAFAKKPREWMPDGGATTMAGAALVTVGFLAPWRSVEAVSGAWQNGMHIGGASWLVLVFGLLPAFLLGFIDDHRRIAYLQGLCAILGIVLLAGLLLGPTWPSWGGWLCLGGFLTHAWAAFNALDEPARLTDGAAAGRSGPEGARPPS